MAKSYKPEDHNTVSPYLLVDGASGTLDFLKRVFGAVELHRVNNSEGGIMHAEVRIEDSVVMLADAEGPRAHVHDPAPPTSLAPAP